MDTTVASQEDVTLEVNIMSFPKKRTFQDSWLDNSSRKRLELIKQRRSLTRRIGKTMGGNYNQFTMDAPSFDPRIETTASCSEDSADEEETPEENAGGSQVSFISFLLNLLHFLLCFTFSN